MTEQSTGEQMVAQGAIVMRYENEQMQAVAVARPRDEAAVKERALAILAGDPDAAASAYYTIPYKKHTRSGGCTGLADDECPVEQEVEGIGIDGARELARLWGNNASRVYFTDEDEDWVRMSGVFVDLETNTRAEVPYAVAKFATDRAGNAYMLKPTRLAMAVQAGVSKCARNAIVQGLPRHVSRAYYQRAKEIVLGSGSVDVPKLLESFATFGVTRERLEGYYGMSLEELEPEQRRQLRGLFVAIRERLVEPDQFFAGTGEGSRSVSDGPAAGPSATPRGRAEGVSPSPVAGSTAEVRGGTQAAPAPQADAQAEAEPEATETEQPALSVVPDPEPEATYNLAPEGIPGPSPEQKAPQATPEPSAPSPDPVDSTPPNDQTGEPEQTDFDGLGI